MQLRHPVHCLALHLQRRRRTLVFKLVYGAILPPRSSRHAPLRSMTRMPRDAPRGTASRDCSCGVARNTTSRPGPQAAPTRRAAARRSPVPWLSRSSGWISPSGMPPRSRVSPFHSSGKDGRLVHQTRMSRAAAAPAPHPHIPLPPPPLFVPSAHRSTSFPKSGAASTAPPLPCRTSWQITSTVSSPAIVPTTSGHSSYPERRRPAARRP